MSVDGIEPSKDGPLILALLPRILIAVSVGKGGQVISRVHGRGLQSSTCRKTQKEMGSSLQSCSALQMETGGGRGGGASQGPPGFLAQGRVAIFIQKECEGKAMVQGTKTWIRWTHSLFL